jgi:hypothetical protein
MRTTLLICAAFLIAAPASGESTRPLKFDRSTSSKSLSVKEPKRDDSCAAYGAGFVKIEGTGTCVQIGGSVSVGAGGSIRGR